MNLQKYKTTCEPALYQYRGESLNFRERIEFFQNMIKYLLRLRDNGDINENTFNFLIKKIIGDFIEIELSARVNKILTDKLKNKVLLNCLVELL